MTASTSAPSSQTYSKSREKINTLFSNSLLPLLKYTLLVGLSVLFLLPFYIIVRNAFMTQSEITNFNEWLWFARELQWSNLTKVFENQVVPMLNALKNSALIAVLQVIGQLVFASMAGYGLARIPYRWSGFVFFYILITLMIPGAVTFLPSYIIVANLGWINTLQGLIVPGLFNSFATVVFRQFYLNFPKELEDASRVDGLSYFGTYWRIVVPNSRGVFISLGAIAFISSWNAYVWPLIVGQSPEWWTVQVAISNYITAQRIDLPLLFMSAAVAIAPLVVLFLFVQRYIVTAYKQSGITG